MAHINIVRTPRRNIQALFERLANVFYEDFNEYEKQTFLFAVFLQLLLEIKQQSAEFAIPESRSLDSVLARALQYIRQSGEFVLTFFKKICYNKYTTSS